MPSACFYISSPRAVPRGPTVTVWETDHRSRVRREPMDPRKVSDASVRGGGQRHRSVSVRRQVWAEGASVQM